MILFAQIHMFCSRLSFLICNLMILKKLVEITSVFTITSDLLIKKKNSKWNVIEYL